MKFKCPKCGCQDCWQEIESYGIGTITYYANGFMCTEIANSDIGVPDEYRNVFKCKNCDEAVTIEDEAS